MMRGDNAYFTDRAFQEREAAVKASHPMASEAHLQLASRYEELANAIAKQERALGIGEIDDPLRCAS